MSQIPQPHHGLHLDEPSEDWVDGVPLGNGALGAMVWGRGHPLCISLDRTDLWDLTPVPEFKSEEYSYSLMRRWHAEGRHDDLARIYDDPYGRAGPTRIPTGRIELRLPRVERLDLDLLEALLVMRLSGGGLVRCLVSATEPVGLIEIAGEDLDDSSIVLNHPAFDADPKVSSLGRLRYPPARRSSGSTFRAFEQRGAEGLEFAVHVAWKKSDGRTLIAWSAASTLEGDEPGRLSRERVESALSRGFDAVFEAHRAWWASFWSKSSVRLSNARLERLWYLELYKLGAAARRGAPPIALQGPWTLDNGELPPWKGDYHHDLNTQLCYWPAYAGNHLEEAASFVDWLWDTREACFEWTQRFFGLPGLNVPMTADLLNRQMGGWRQYTHSATTSAWLAHHFYLHYQYSRDPEFLRERAYPYLRDVAVFLEAVSRERDSSGKRTLPLSASPEIHDNRPEAWFSSLTNYDNALMRWTFQAAAELAGELALPSEAARFRAVAAELPELALGADGRLLIAAGHPLPYSHRHHSHMMALHPLGLLDPYGDDRARRTANATLAELEGLGTRAWNGYSFAWAASLWARAGEGRRAERALEIFDEAFVSNSGLHVNGDHRKLGYADFHGRPMTLEGNLAAAEGIHQMLLQSHGGLVRLFPALPESWRDASFSLRAEGAFLISATKSDGRVERVSVQAEAGGTCRLLSPWTGRVLEIAMRPGESRELSGDPDGRLLSAAAVAGE